MFKYGKPSENAKKKKKQEEGEEKKKTASKLFTKIPHIKHFGGNLFSRSAFLINI